VVQSEEIKAAIDKEVI